MSVVPPVDALIQAWGQIGGGAAASMAFDGVRRGVVRVDDVRLRLAEYPRVRDRRALERLLVELRGGVQSHLEHLAATCVFNTRDFAGFARQVGVRAGGQRYVLDMLHADAGVAIELDGRAFHSDDAARRRDLARDANLATVGIATIRLTYEDITRRPEWCRSRARRAIAARRSPRAARVRA